MPQCYFSFLKVSWSFGKWPESWPWKGAIESRVESSELAEKDPIRLHAHVVRAIGGPQLHSCPFHGSDWGSRVVKWKFVLGVNHLEGLVVSYSFCDMCKRSDWLCLVGSTSLTVHGELNQIVVAARHMFTPIDWLTWINVGGGCYRIKVLFVWSSLT